MIEYYIVSSILLLSNVFIWRNLSSQIKSQKGIINDQAIIIGNFKTLIDSFDIAKLKSLHEETIRLKDEQTAHTINKVMRDIPEKLLEEFNKVQAPVASEFYTLFFRITMNLPKEERRNFIVDNFPVSKQYLIPALERIGHIDHDSKNSNPG